MKPFTVIAHRGASGYLPEHTLESVAMAHAMGSDFIEQDVILTRDNVLVVLHDLYLDAVTDVAERFPGRNRDDGHYYAIDFALAEIRTLRVNERVEEDGRPVFPGRFPTNSNIFRVPTLEEEIVLIQGLNKSTGREVGLYIEPKSPAWHRDEGRDIIAETLQLLARKGCQSRKDPIYLQSFDMNSLKRARSELKTELKLVQLIGENSWRESDTDFDYLRTDRGLREVAAYADGIGPWLLQIVDIYSDGPADISGLTRSAQSIGLFVHAYTLRADQLPTQVKDINSALDILIAGAGLDGLFTDHPDLVCRYLEERL